MLKRKIASIMYHVHVLFVISRNNTLQTKQYQYLARFHSISQSTRDRRSCVHMSCHVKNNNKIMRKKLLVASLSFLNISDSTWWETWYGKLIIHSRFQLSSHLECSYMFYLIIPQISIKSDILPLKRSLLFPICDSLLLLPQKCYPVILYSTT